MKDKKTTRKVLAFNLFVTGQGMNGFGSVCLAADSFIFWYEIILRPTQGKRWGVVVFVDFVFPYVKRHKYI